MSKRKNTEAQPLLAAGISWVLHGVGTLMVGLMRGIGWLLRMIGKGIVWSIRQTWHGTVWLVTFPWRLLRFLINGRIPKFENTRQEEIFWRIKRQYRRKRFLMLHGMVYMLGLLYLSGIAVYELYRQWFATLRPENDIFQVSAIMALWTVMMLFHRALVRMGDAEDKALGEALEREYTRSERGQNDRGQVDLRESDFDERYERLSEPVYDEDLDYLDYGEKPKHKLSQR